MEPKLAIRCQSKIHGDRGGNLVCAVVNNAIYIKCQDRDCKRWTKLTINVPGIKIDFSSAGIVQEVMPQDYHLHLEPAPVVVSTK